MLYTALLGQIYQREQVAHTWHWPVLALILQSLPPRILMQLIRVCDPFLEITATFIRDFSRRVESYFTMVAIIWPPFLYLYQLRLTDFFHHLVVWLNQLFDCTVHTMFPPWLMSIMKTEECCSLEFVWSSTYAQV